MSQQVKTAVENLVGAIKKDPQQAKAVFESESRLKDGLQVKTLVRDFTFGVDEPEVLGGTDTAPNPVEYVLAALGSCQAITYKALAAAKGIKLDGIRFKAKGHLDLQGFLGLDESVRPGFNKVEFETTLFSDEDPQVLERLSKQVEALCPVLDILTQPVEVKGQVEIKTAEKTAILA